MPTLIEFSSAVPSLSALDLWKRRHLTRSVLFEFARDWSIGWFSSLWPSVPASSLGTAVAESLEGFTHLQDCGSEEETQKVTASRQAGRNGSRSCHLDSSEHDLKDALGITPGRSGLLGTGLGADVVRSPTQRRWNTWARTTRRSKTPLAREPREMAMVYSAL